MFCSFFYEKMLTRYFFSYQRRRHTNTTEFSTRFFVKTEQSSVKNKTCCMLQIKNHFYREIYYLRKPIALNLILILKK